MIAVGGRKKRADGLRASHTVEVGGVKMKGKNRRRPVGRPGVEQERSERGVVKVKVSRENSVEKLVEGKSEVG